MSGMTEIVYIGVAILGAMFFAGSETGVLSVNEARLRGLAETGNAAARRLLRILEKKNTLLATLLVGNNLAVVTASALSTALFVEHFGTVGLHYSTLVVSGLLLFFGEIVPKAVYLANGMTLLLLTERILSVLVLVFSPVTKVVLLIPEAFIRLVGRRKSGVTVTREELQFLLHSGITQQAVTGDEHWIIRRLLHFSQKRVRSATTPILDVVVMKEDVTAREAIDLFTRHNVSRIPVYREKVENITGIVFLTDLFVLEDFSVPVRDIARTPYFVPEQKALSELFPEIWDRYEIAVVVDEYGVATGIVTAVDIIEEIMGELGVEPDDAAKHSSVELMKGVFVMDATLSLADFYDVTGRTLPPGDYETVAGFIVTALQKIPQTGETFVLEDMEFTILEATPRRVQKVLVRMSPKNEA